MYNNALPELKMNAQNANGSTVPSVPVLWYESSIEANLHLAHDTSYFRRRVKVKRDEYLINLIRSRAKLDRSTNLKTTRFALQWNLKMAWSW